MQIIFEAELSLSEGPSKVNENELSLDEKFIHIFDFTFNLDNLELILFLLIQPFSN